MKIIPCSRKSGQRIQPRIPGDKSLAHRAAIFASLAWGQSEIAAFPTGADNASTIQLLGKLGVKIRKAANNIHITGQGIGGLAEPDQILDCGNSGTTMRLMSGVLAGHNGSFVLSGDQSLSSRPMARIITPLRAMGAHIDGSHDGTRAPLAIRGNPLQGIRWDSPVASAQIKSAILLAGLHAKGNTVVREPLRSRDHSERMLEAMGAPITYADCCASLHLPPLGDRTQMLAPLHMQIPGDPSAAAFFVALFSQTAGSIQDLLVNPTRTGLMAILQDAGLQFVFENQRISTGEPLATCTWQAGQLHRPLRPDAGQMVDAIDEFPLLCAVAATTAGTHELRHAAELRAKESDRIANMASMLAKAGVPFENHPDGLTIKGGGALRPFAIHAAHDHRIAMTAAILAILAGVEATIDGAEVAEVSFPGFYAELERMELARCIA